MRKQYSYREKQRFRYIERRDRFTKLHDEGMSYEKIGKRFGLSKQRVWQIMNEMGSPDAMEE
jgi:transposase